MKIRNAQGHRVKVVLVPRTAKPGARLKSRKDR